MHLYRILPNISNTILTHFSQQNCRCCLYSRDFVCVTLCSLVILEKNNQNKKNFQNIGVAYIYFSIFSVFLLQILTVAYIRVLLIFGRIRYHQHLIGFFQITLLLFVQNFLLKEMTGNVL